MKTKYELGDEWVDDDQEDYHLWGQWGSYNPVLYNQPAEYGYYPRHLAANNIFYGQSYDTQSCQSNTECADPTPYCDRSTGQCFQCHTDQVCPNAADPDIRNRYCLTDTCQECNIGTYSKNAKSKQCLPYGNYCGCSNPAEPGDPISCSCKCRHKSGGGDSTIYSTPCDWLSDSPTCTGDTSFSGCSSCKKDSDCPSWRSKCIDSDEAQYNTASNGTNYSGYCCPTGDPDSCMEDAT